MVFQPSTNSNHHRREKFRMKKTLPILFVSLLCAAPLTLRAQSPTPASKSSAAQAKDKRTDVYHVFVVKAAPGKAKELANWLKEPDPDHPDGKGIVLRHQDGDSWDFIAIEHIGAKATVDMGGTPMTPNQRTLTDWHADTFVAGPPWSEFAREMGIDGDSAKTAGSAYVVSDYRAVPGQRDELEKMLTEGNPNDPSSGNVLFAHLEGASWNFLGIVRYDSWEKFAEGEKSSAAQTSKGQGGWYELRKHCAVHHDTLTDRLLP
jgi:hypothetical protein